MKIISDANSWSRIVRCGSCSTKLEVEVADIRKAGGYYVKCPVCCSSISMEALPRYIIEDISERSCGC